jgi:hypothetical protein
MKIFQRVKSIFVPKQKQLCEHRDSHLLRIHIHREKLSEVVLSGLYSRMKKYLRKGYQYTEEELTEEIPSEYIGIARWYYEETLICQRYVRYQELKSDEMLIWYQLPHELSELSSVSLEACCAYDAVCAYYP